MDQGTRIVENPVSSEFLTGRRIITSNNIPYGTVYVTNQYVLTRPTNDLVWDVIWPRIISSEKGKAGIHLAYLVQKTRLELGLPLTTF